MKRNLLKTLSLACILTFTMGTFVGCGKNTNDNASTENKVTGQITVAGSSALQPLVQEGAKMFTEKNPSAIVNVQGGGSGTGLTQVVQGSIDIGNSDIFAEEKLKEAGKELVDHKVCVVGFVPVVNSKIDVDNLTKEQLIKIFTGEITNWKDVGGKDLKIVIINRPKSSGTRTTFKKYALDGKDEVEGKSLTEDTSGAVKKTIETTEGAIGYLASSYLSNKDNSAGIKTLKFNGVEMNKENIISGKYTIASYEHMYTKGEPTGITKDFLNFMMNGNEVKALIEKLGYYATSDMKVELK